MYHLVIHPPHISTVLYFKGIKSDFTANRKAVFQEYICREPIRNLKIIRTLLRTYRGLQCYPNFCIKSNIIDKIEQLLFGFDRHRAKTLRALPESPHEIFSLKKNEKVREE